MKIVLASHNPHKAEEFAALLDGLGLEIVSAGALDLPEPEETGESFAENAALKAKAAAKASGLPALADDSGLSVYALGGAPGIYSARWAGPEKDFTAAMRRIETELAGQNDRRAAFICVLAYAQPDGRVETFEGRCEGELVWPPRPGRAFGYDPVFVPSGETRSFSEMTGAEKDFHSHRGKAVAAFRAAFSA